MKDLFKLRLPIGKIEFTKGSLEDALDGYTFQPGTQPDLLYARSVLCSEGANKRRDGFLRNLLFDIYKTAIHKFVDYEHDPAGSNENGQNPEKYHIIGHIYASYLMDQETKEIIPDEYVIRDEDGEMFPIGSPYRNSKLDVVVDWVLYKFEFPEIAEQVYNTISGETSGFGVSMEILFSDYKFRVGEFDPAEKFEFDANAAGAVEAKRGSNMSLILKELWAAGMDYHDKPIYRILGQEAFFSGMAVTSNRANPRSWNLSTASEVIANGVDETTASKDLIGLIKAVASKNKEFTMADCKIVNGEPDCNCLQSALASELGVLVENLNKLKGILEDKDLEITESALEKPCECQDPMCRDPECDYRQISENIGVAVEKRKDVNPKSGEHKYGDVKFADPKNKKYPIDTEKHIRAAWNYIHHKKNSGKYSSDDSKPIKARIAAAWRSKIDKNGPPSAKED